MSISKLSSYEAALHTEGAQALLALSDAPPAEWPDLPKRMITRPFPLTALPLVGRDMVEAVTEAVQAPLDMVACFLLGALSTCAVGRGRVHVWPGYDEPLQLYIVVSADPGERKTPTQARMFAPVRAFEEVRNKELAPLLRDNAARISMKKKQMAKHEQQGHETEVLALAEEIEELGLLRPFELMISEGTTEAVGARMAANGGRLAVVSDEGGFLRILSGAYSQKDVNLDVVLQGYPGGPVSSARITRDTPRIKDAALSVTLAVQPGVLNRAIADSSLIESGLISRFLLSAPTPAVGRRRIDVQPVPDAVAQRYADRLTWMLKQPTLHLSLSREASALDREWRHATEPRLSPGRDLSGLFGGWGAKLAGNTCRIAGLLSLLEGDSSEVSGPIMQSAVTIAEYFIDQAKALAKVDLLISSEASEVLEFIEKLRQPTFAPSKVKQKLRDRATFKGPKGSILMDKCFDELSHMGYIRLGAVPAYSGVGRPPQAMYEVHPELLAQPKPEVLEL